MVVKLDRELVVSLALSWPAIAFSSTDLECSLVKLCLLSLLFSVTTVDTHWYVAHAQVASDSEKWWIVWETAFQADAALCASESESEYTCWMGCFVKLPPTPLECLISASHVCKSNASTQLRAFSESLTIFPQVKKIFLQVSNNNNNNTETNIFVFFFIFLSPTLFGIYLSAIDSNSYL